MTDMKRSLPDLQALFADNTSGDISPQDLRDFLVSVLGTYGTILNSDNAVTQTLAAATEATLEWTTNGESEGVFLDAAGDGDIGVAVTGTYKVCFSASFKYSISGKTFDFRLAKNGTSQSIKCSQYLATGDNVTTVGFVGDIALAAADKVSVNVECDIAGVLTLVDGQFSIHRVK